MSRNLPLNDAGLLQGGEGREMEGMGAAAAGTGKERRKNGPGKLIQLMHLKRFRLYLLHPYFRAVGHVIGLVMFAIL